MMTFEEKLFPKREADVKRFQAAARAIFATPEGKLVLSMVCSAANPLRHTPGMTEHEHGQCEVVSTLWRFGASDTTIQNQ